MSCRLRTAMGWVGWGGLDTRWGERGVRNCSVRVGGLGGDCCGVDERVKCTRMKEWTVRKERWTASRVNGWWMGWAARF